MKAPFLTEQQITDEISQKRGLIPVSIDPTLRQLVWLDLDSYHCYEGFFHQSLATYAALDRTPHVRFRTSIEALDVLSPDDSLPPAGFIFHGGRCGSTLLAKVLARSRQHMVFSEAAPHNQVWKILPECPKAAVARYRNLVLAMGRRRLASYRSHFIKFTSFNVVRFEFIRTAFPDTPAIFLFRHPDAVLESSARETHAFLGHDLGLGHIWQDAGAAYEEFCHAALAVRDPQFRCLDYAGLTPRNLPAILRFLRQEPPPAELTLMESEFLWDAKSGLVPRRFVPRRFFPRDNGGAGRAGASLRTLYDELVMRAATDWPQA